MGLVGQKKGRLTILALSRVEERHYGLERFYRCKCDCGNIIEVRGASLSGKNPNTQSCGCLQKERTAEARRRIAREASEVKAMRRDEELIGKRFGRLLVLRRGEVLTLAGGARRPTYVCKCKCGTECQVYATYLLKGLTKSCGCLRKEVTAENGRKLQARRKAEKKQRSNV